MALAIKIEQLSKMYHLGQVGTGSFYKDVKRFSAKIQGKEDPYLKIGEVNDRTVKGGDVVYSLKDISIDIEQGDSVGIIGSNGAGKSTLLKLISRITSPTTGQIKIKGRVASLLEVGTGFHPELTGLENIYLNGAILGMRKQEIKQKLEEIIDFSGVEKYIDTPVKRYSSGMYVRLAFSVAAHLDSEILIVDEVLSVGDAAFQKKCLGKMESVSKGLGRTVLFVSHNMGAVKTLCNKGLFLEYGTSKHFGQISDSVSLYLGGGDIQHERRFQNKGIPNLFGLQHMSIKNCTKSGAVLVDSDALELSTILEFQSAEAGKYGVTYHLYNEFGEALFSFSHDQVLKLKNGLNELKTIFPANFFQSGTYYLHFLLVYENREVVFYENDIFTFILQDGAKELGVYLGREPGYIRPNFKWELK